MAAHLKAQGVTGRCPFCWACGHSGVVPFDAIGLPDVTPFPDNGRARRFSRSSRGARQGLAWSVLRARFILSRDRLVLANARRHSKPKARHTTRKRTSSRRRRVPLSPIKR